MPAFGSLAIATSGMRAAQVNLAVTGHNISNSELPGFSRQRIVQTTNFTETRGVMRNGMNKVVGLGTDWNSIHQIRNEFLDFSYRQNVSRLAFHSNMVQTGLVIESVIGELYGAYNFQGELNNLWFSIQELTSNPSGIETRELFLATVNSFLNKAQDVFEGLFEYQQNLDAQIRATVADVNATVAEIERLNRLIYQTEMGGDRANDFRDQRNLAIDRLSELIPLDVFTGPRGDIILFSQGHELLANGHQTLMGLRFISSQFSFVEPVLTPARHILPANTPPDQFVSFTNYRVPINNARGNDLGKLNALLLSRGTAPKTHMCPTRPRPENPAALLNQINAEIIDPAHPLFGTTVEALINAVTAADTPADIADAEAARDAALAYLGISLDAAVEALAFYNNGHYRAAVHNWNAHNWSVNNAMIPRVMIQLDKIVNSIVRMINDALTGNLREANPDFDAGQPESASNPRFRYVFRNDDGTPRIPLDAEQNEGIPLFIRHVDRNDENPPWPLGPYDQNHNNISSIFSIRNIRINPAFADTGGHNLLALSLSGAPNDTDLLIALQQAWMYGGDIYGVSFFGGEVLGVQDAYIRMTNAISTQISEASSYVDAQKILVQQTGNMRQSVKGASMDEELSAMLRFQFAFQAASRIFNVIDGMIDQVVNRTGRIGM